jgi:hypothetical protein
MPSKKKMNCLGRPPKFQEPRRPVTMTLPERILTQLTEIDPDRSRAVVKIMEAAVETDKEHFKPVELVEMAGGKSLIVVGPNKALRKIPWLKMIEIAQTRYLLTIPSGTSIEALEVALHDLFHHSDLRKNEGENAVLQELLHLIGHQRRTQCLSKAEILIVDTGRSANVSPIPSKPVHRKTIIEDKEEKQKR